MMQQQQQQQSLKSLVHLRRLRCRWTVMFLCCRSSSSLLSLSQVTTRRTTSTLLYQSNHHHKSPLSFQRFTTTATGTGTAFAFTSTSTGNLGLCKRYLSSRDNDNDDDDDDSFGYNDDVMIPTKRRRGDGDDDDDDSKSLPPLLRLYNMEQTPLRKGALVSLSETQSNHIHVMRLNSAKRWGPWTGHLKLFDEYHGEWLAKLVVSIENDQQQNNDSNTRKRNNRQSNSKKRNTSILVECVELLRPSPSSASPLQLLEASKDDNTTTGTGTIQQQQSKQKQQQPTTIHLYMGRIKKQRRKWIFEKVTELGITSIHAVDTEYSAISDSWEYPKHYLQIIEAAEQCERFTIPKLSENPLTWKELTSQIISSSKKGMMTATTTTSNNNDNKNNNILWLVCRERQPSSKSLLQAIQQRFHGSNNDFFQAIHILVGPEGGWSPTELDELEELLPLGNVQFVTLGPLILRAETAAISAVATVMMALDDDNNNNNNYNDHDKDDNDRSS